MPKLRMIAKMLGYAIYYPGIYAKIATIYPCYLDAVSRQSFIVNMADVPRGLKEIERTLQCLSNN